ncbi:MAG: hypothetical protein VZS44_02795 [Bacilli bacterium]|nr:hypothetical protein [Bacilli bacterium]
MRIFIEYILVFILVYLLNYFLLVRNNKKLKKKDMSPELVYLNKLYDIDVKKIDYKKFVYINAFLNTFIVTSIYIIIIYLISSLILRIILGIVLLLLMIIICYGLLGRYYLWLQNKKK